MSSEHRECKLNASVDLKMLPTASCHSKSRLSDRGIDYLDESKPMKIVQKWGFGMAPIKSDVQNSRLLAAKAVVQLLTGSERTSSRDALDALSIIKGLYSRSFRQDQWDWFTVWSQLGRPGQKNSAIIARNLKLLRDALSKGDAEGVLAARAKLQEHGLARSLHLFIQGSVDGKEIGQIYILSTREARSLLKIGYTERRVEERVKEINSSTGVLIPYGVRAVWSVKAARDVESGVHGLLGAYRIRPDREFFEVDFKEAFSQIRDYIYSLRIEEDAELIHTAVPAD